MEPATVDNPRADGERPDLSIVIPAYREAASLPELAEGIQEALDDTNWSYRVWIIDDGSRDDTWEVVRRLHNDDSRFVGLQFQRNYGKSAALAVGFKWARGTYVVTMDADLQDDPAEIPGLVERLDEGYDLVSGWKKNRKDPWTKTVPSRFFNWVTRRISGLPLHDFNCGLKAYRREVVQSVDVYGELHRYIPLLAKWAGYSDITEKPVEHHPRKYGETKFGTKRFIKGFLDLITVIFLTRFAVRPMHFFGALGTVTFGTGFLINLWLTIDKLVFGNPLGDRPLLLLGLLLILFGAQMFTTGLLGEMIIQPRMEDTASYVIGDRVLSEDVSERQPGPRSASLEE